MTDNFDFIEEAYQTVSPLFCTHRVPAGEVSTLLDAFIDVGENLDDVKKGIFYDREVSLNKMYREDAPEMEWSDQLDADLVHGILGIATEGVELVQALQKTLNGGEAIDTVNVLEECGDVLWYVALILRKSGKSFDEAMRTVIAKLRKRFPDKFTAYDAKNRDLTAERAILEDGFSS